MHGWCSKMQIRFCTLSPRNIGSQLQDWICCNLLFARGAPPLLTSDGFLFLEPLAGWKGGRLSHNVDGKIFSWESCRNCGGGISKNLRWNFHWRGGWPGLVSTSRRAVAERWWKGLKIKRGTLQHYLRCLSRLPPRIQMLDPPIASPSFLEKAFSHLTRISLCHHHHHHHRTVNTKTNVKMSPVLNYCLKILSHLLHHLCNGLNWLICFLPSTIFSILPMGIFADETKTLKIRSRAAAIFKLFASNCQI